MHAQLSTGSSPSSSQCCQLPPNLTAPILTSRWSAACGAWHRTAGEGAGELEGDHFAVWMGLRSSVAKPGEQDLCQGLPAICWQIPRDGWSLGGSCKRRARACPSCWGSCLEHPDGGRGHWAVPRQQAGASAEGQTQTLVLLLARPCFSLPGTSSHSVKSWAALNHSALPTVVVGLFFLFLCSLPFFPTRTELGWVLWLDSLE